MTQVVAKVYGAVSIVNAIAIGKGSTLGIDTCLLYTSDAADE